METMHPTAKEIQIENLLEAVQARRPALREWLKANGKKTLAEYGNTMLENRAVPIQPREDLAEVVKEYASPILGDERAEALANQLTKIPVIVTANHHGPDFMGLTRQGVGVSALAHGPNTDVPVFACGAVPHKNVTWPRGIVLSREQHIPERGSDGQILTNQDGTPKTRAIPVRINVFPEKDVERMVGVTAPYTEDMIQGAKKNPGALGQIKSLRNNQVLSEAEYSALKSIFESIYLDPSIRSQPSYSDQSTLVNDRLWKMSFSQELQGRIPTLAYLELEKIVSGLLEKDLLNTESLMHRILFDPELRKIVVQELDGVETCWDIQKLMAINDKMNPLPQSERVNMMGGAGSMFFLGVDTKGRRVPLALVNSANEGQQNTALEEQPLYLRGTDKSGNEYSIDFTPQGLVDALRDKKILPSVFTDFVELAFARGMKCYGGFNQANYLPKIKTGLTDALQKSGYTDWAQSVNTVPIENLNAGLMYAVAKYEDGVKPAGALDFVVNPLTPGDYEKMKRLTVREAFLFGLPSMYHIVTPDGERTPDLSGVTEEDIYKTIGHKFVEIKY